jgi:hypothetical protein
MEELRRSHDRETELAHVLLPSLRVAAVSLLVFEDLIKERLAVGYYASSGLVCPDALQEGEAKILLEVPLQPLLFLLGEGIGDGYGMLATIIEADRGVGDIL